MGYLEDFFLYIKKNNSKGFLSLWNEYFAAEEFDENELLMILEAVSNSSLAHFVGDKMDVVMPFFNNVNDEKIKDDILRIILNLQTTNDDNLAELACNFLKKHYKNESHFNEKMRIVGLTNKQNFTKAIQNFEFLNHMKRGNFVYHSGGWGTGEIIDLSFIREQLFIEFENVTCTIEMSIENAFKHLSILPSDHIFARRFGDPQKLEKEAKANPVAVIKDLLKDLGKKTSSDIKNELSGFIIPDAEWPKWWQLTRTKLRKDGTIVVPTSSKDFFMLRKEKITQEDSIFNDIDKAKSFPEVVKSVTSLLKYFPRITKATEKTSSVINKIKQFYEFDNDVEFFESRVLLKEFGAEEICKELEEWIKSRDNLEEILNKLDINFFKKQLLALIFTFRDDWVEFFSNVIFDLQCYSLREFCLKSLNQEGTVKVLEKKIEDLLKNSLQYPESFFWYFQKVVSINDKSVVEYPFQNQNGIFKFFEGFFTLFMGIESNPVYKELTKKMYNFVTKTRYLVIRSVIKMFSTKQLEEFLLLATKCKSFSEKDIKILNSLIEVSRPEFFGKRMHRKSDHDRIWTTEAGFKKIKNKIQEISSVHIIENAKEIETARALGDLRENASYKSAIEKRQRLQGELKQLMQQINKAQIISPDDVSTESVGIGTIVSIEDEAGSQYIYTLLGPWDVDVDNNILSISSKFVQTMLGLKVNDKFSFQDKNYAIKDISNFFDGVKVKS